MLHAPIFPFDIILSNPSMLPIFVLINSRYSLHFSRPWYARRNHLNSSVNWLRFCPVPLAVCPKYRITPASSPSGFTTPCAANRWYHRCCTSPSAWGPWTIMAIIGINTVRYPAHRARTSAPCTIPGSPQWTYILRHPTSKMRTVIRILDLPPYLDHPILAGLRDCTVHHPGPGISTTPHLMPIIVSHLRACPTTVHPFLHLLRQKYLILEPVPCRSRMSLGNPGPFDILLPELMSNMRGDGLLVADGN